jgi:hypothetical protein
LSDENVPKFRRLPVLAFFLREYSRYSPEFNLRIMLKRCGAAWRGLAGLARHEKLCRRMVDHDDRRALLGLKQEPRSQAQTSVFFGMEQPK